jgi:hypothetical protein
MPNAGSREPGSYARKDLVVDSVLRAVPDSSNLLNDKSAEFFQEQRTELGGQFQSADRSSNEMSNLHIRYVRNLMLVREITLLRAG